MAKAHIYCYGEIGSCDPFFGSDMVSLKSVVDVINANPDADEFVVHIHSRGGEVSEGFAIYDTLRATGKTITTIIEGLCASIATVVALAGDNRQMTPNSEFMIHNPWGLAGGDATDIQKYADQVKAIEDKLINFYVEKTGNDLESIKSMMNDETFFTPAKALELKFITQILEPTKAFAKIKLDNAMSKELETLSKTITDGFASIKNMFKNTIKALDLATSDGKMLVVETTATEAAVGDKVTLNGAPAPDGDYLMEDGDTITVAGGAVTAITMPAADTSKAELDALNKTIADLKAENEKLKAESAAKATLETDINAKFKEMQTSLKAMSIDFDINTGKATVFNKQKTDAEKSVFEKAQEATAAKKEAEKK